MTITEFLLARIAEDEAVLERRGAFPHSTHGLDAAGAYNPRCPDCLGLPGKARVLAECKAKRAILAEHRPEVETVEWFDTVSDTGTAPVCPSCRPKEPIEWHPRPGEAGVRPEGFVPTYVLAPCPTLQALAAVYANHPDYARVSDTPTKE